jgi:hypothetical protein
MYLWSTMFFILYCLVCVMPVLAHKTVVDTENGPVWSDIVLTTKCGDKYLAFRGIPYAAPPIGSLRFQVSRLGCSQIDANVPTAREKVGLGDNVYWWKYKIVPAICPVYFVSASSKAPKMAGTEKCHRTRFRLLPNCRRGRYKKTRSLPAIWRERRLSLLKRIHAERKYTDEGIRRISRARLTENIIIIRFVLESHFPC